MGTQLALCVATLLDLFVNGQARPLQQLAESMGRGRRSSIGTHGFAQGGLLYERGKRADQTLAPLAERVQLPPGWRVVQICPRGEAGLWGEAENHAFRQLPPVPAQVTQQLVQEVQQRMLPAARGGQLEQFGESVFRFGVQAGNCFASRQGGPFASPLLEHWVTAIRRRGVHGVGQSSWGPTLFAFLGDEVSAQDFVQWFRRDCLTSSCPASLLSSPIAQEGAHVMVLETTG